MTVSPVFQSTASIAGGEVHSDRRADRPRCAPFVIWTDLIHLDGSGGSAYRDRKLTVLKPHRETCPICLPGPGNVEFMQAIKVRLLQKLADHHVVLSERTAIEQASRNTRASLLVACMPKSGSTYLRTALTLLTRYPSVPLVYAWEQQEQNLYLPAVLRTWGRPIISQAHLKATQANVELMAMFNLRPIVLVRNLYDVVVSIRDYLSSVDEQGPMGYVGTEFFEFDEAEQFDFIIDVLLPWHFSFFVTWQRLDTDCGVEPVWVTYEQLCGDPVDVLSRIAAAGGIPVTPVSILETLERASRYDTRRNVGRPGRGLERLSASHRRRIEQMAGHYPDTDFRMLGITANRKAEAS